MNDPTNPALLLSLLLLGLGGSLHCTAMCGPILLSFQRALGGKEDSRPGLDFFLYHGGRIWTYALLGFLVGLSGQAVLAWREPLTLLAALVLIAGGTFSLVASTRSRAILGAPNKCLVGTESSLLGPLLKRSNPMARLVLGALMGLLPCGLVYAALLLTFAFGNPLLSALGMLLFGIGTTPSLTIVLLGGQWTRKVLGPSGARLTATLLILGGLLMLGRVFLARHTQMNHF